MNENELNLLDRVYKTLLVQSHEWKYDDTLRDIKTISANFGDLKVSVAKQNVFSESPSKQYNYWLEICASSSGKVLYGTSGVGVQPVVDLYEHLQRLHESAEKYQVEQEEKIKYAPLEKLLDVLEQPKKAKKAGKKK